MAGTDRQDPRGGGLNRPQAVLLAGASGLVGRHLLELFAEHRESLELDLLLRSQPSKVPVRATVFVGDPLADALASWVAASRPCDVFVCALGTTRRAAGSLQAFAAIDRDLVVELAAAARAAGACRAIVVSSVGADASAANDYLRVKGEMERAVAALGFERCDFLRPGLLLGERHGGHARPAERIAQWLAPAANLLLRGRLRRFRSISARQVARAAVQQLDEAGQGVFAHSFDSLNAASASPPASAKV